MIKTIALTAMLAGYIGLQAQNYEQRRSRQRSVAAGSDFGACKRQNGVGRRAPFKHDSIRRSNPRL